MSVRQASKGKLGSEEAVASSGEKDVSAQEKGTSDQKENTPLQDKASAERVPAAESTAVAADLTMSPARSAEKKLPSRTYAAPAKKYHVRSRAGAPRASAPISPRGRVGEKRAAPTSSPSPVRSPVKRQICRKNLVPRNLPSFSRITRSHSKQLADMKKTQDDLTKAMSMMSVPHEGWPDITHEVLLRPGKSAPRWLRDFCQGRLGDFCDEDGGQRLGDLFVQCRKSTLTDFLALPGHESTHGEHELLMVETQSKGTSQISCICRFCKYHFLFLFHVERDADSVRTCGQAHNLVRVGLDEQVPLVDGVADAKFFPVTSRAEWRCSSTQCTARIQVYMTRPRISMEHMMVVADTHRIERQREEATRQDPERFKDLPKNITETALMTLNAYLRDITKKPLDTQTIKIAARNKRFLVQFGEPCSDFFEYLGFAKKEIGGEIYWLLPDLEHYEGNKTPIGSQRSFYEDVRSEVQALMDSSDAFTTTKEVAPVQAIHRLRQALDPTPATAPIRMSEDNIHYQHLGVLPNSDDGTIQLAYQAQTRTDPGHKEKYLSALQGLAGRPGASADLQLFAVQEVSLEEANSTNSDNTPLAAAFRYFDLKLDNPVDDQFIINYFKARCDGSPEQEGDHRQKLTVIARSRKSTVIMKEACLGMSFKAACQVLGLDLKEMNADGSGEVPDGGSVSLYADIAVKEGRADSFLAAAALEVIADHYEALRAPLLDVANSYRNSEGNEVFEELMPNVPVAVQQQVDLSVPPGLKNLRNTCYLNSILQYFYTVTPVRDLVKKYDPHHEEAAFPALMTAEQAEIYVGKELLQFLYQLFIELQVSVEDCVSPPQRLANAASLSISRIANPTASGDKNNTHSTATPPPLPARPGTSQPSSTGATDNSSTHVSSTETTVTVASVDDEPGISTPASIASSQTLIDHPMEDSVQEVADANAVEPMTDSSPVMVGKDIEDKMDTTATAESTTATETTATSATSTPANAQMVSKQAIDAILEQSEIHGSDQMDVEEIMGRFISYMRAAINPRSISDQSIPDEIFDTFYTRFLEVSTPKGGSDYTRKPSVSRWFTAYPGTEGKVSLYDALDASFDREIITTNAGDKLRHMAIDKAPPIFHICVQRSTMRGTKNSNPVEIPDVLYLDRYMDAEEDSALFQARKKGWNIKEQLESYRKLSSLAAAPPTSPSANPATTSAAASPVSRVEEGLLGFDDVDDDEFVLVGDTKSSVGELIDDEPVVVGEKEAAEKEDEVMEDSPSAVEAGLRPETIAPAPGSGPEELKAELAGLFTGLTTHKYRLHAVICHAGQMAAGHYWVWIFDFGAGVWRRYNDTTVTERPVADTPAVLEELSSRGEPYYLAYVRDEDKDNFVAVLPRVSDQAPAAAAAAEPAPVAEAIDEDLPPYSM